MSGLVFAEPARVLDVDALIGERGEKVPSGRWPSRPPEWRSSDLMKRMSSVVGDL